MEITRTTFHGLEALEVKTLSLEAIVLTQVGPRIISLKTPGGKELMFQDPAIFGDQPDPNKVIGRGTWRIMGGSRVWTFRSPGADETEESYAPDNDPCTVEENNASLTVTGWTHPVFLIQRGFQIMENPHGGLDVTSFVINRSERMLWSGGVWAITVVDPACSIGVLTGDPNSNWLDPTYKIVWEWARHHTTQQYIDKQLKIQQGLLLTLPGNEEGKVMVQSPIGAIVAQNDDMVFLKLVKYQPDRAADYPGGCNAAIYSAPGKVFRESETMGSCCHRLEPNAVLTHTERWILGPSIPWSNINALHHLARHWHFNED